MSYTINLEEYCNSFNVPKAVAGLLKIANEKQIKVIISCLSNLAGGISAEKISEDTGISLSEVEDALNFWAERNILVGEKKTEKELQKEPKAIVRKDERPTRQDVAKRGLEDKALSMLLNEAQMKFGRSLKTNEASSLVWIYDDLGLSVSVILLLLQYAVSEGRANISFMEKTAQAWVEAGVSNVTQAEKIIAEETNKKLAWGIVERIFGIEHRRPSEKEKEYANLWLKEWKMSEELLSCAYEECVNQKSKFIMSYTAKILEKWHKDGVKTPDDITKAASKNTNKNERRSFAAYNVELFEKMLNSDD